MTAHPTDEDFAHFIDVNKDNILFTIYCDRCSHKNSFISFTEYDLRSFPPGFLTAVIKAQKMGEENHFCKCGGNLKIDAKSEEILYNILNKERDAFFALLFGGLMSHGKN